MKTYTKHPGYKDSGSPRIGEMPEQCEIVEAKKIFNNNSITDFDNKKFNYMKSLILLFVVFVFLGYSCQNTQSQVAVKDFTHRDSLVMQSARKIISNCYFGTLITIDAKGQPKARAMEPFEPDDNFVIWMATNPRSRKVKEIKRNPKATMHYFSKQLMAYVSLMGTATLVNDKESKQKYWKEGWERFYPDREKDYILIRFVPDVLELIDIPAGLTGDKNTWKPEQVVLRR